MGEMTALTPTIQGTVYTFRLLEADIPVLTFSNNSMEAIHDAHYGAYLALCAAIGRNTTDDWVNSDAYSTLFRDLIEPRGMTDYNLTAPTGKPLLVRAAQALADAKTQFEQEVFAVLTLSLKGGGLSLQAAANAADPLTRINMSADGKFNYIQGELVPSILRAAAAA